MNFVTKLIISIISIASTIVAAIWGSFEHLDTRMNAKVNEGKQEVLFIVDHMRNERNALLKASDEKTYIQMTAINSQMQELRKDVRSILYLTKKQTVLRSVMKDIYSTENIKGKYNERVSKSN